jgi:hypothetical protein
MIWWLAYTPDFMPVFFAKTHSRFSAIVGMTCEPTDFGEIKIDDQR